MTTVAGGHNNDSRTRPPIIKALSLQRTTHPRFRPSLVPSSFFHFLSLFLLTLPGAQPGAFFLNQPYIGRQTPIRDPDPTTNGCRILVSKRVPHPEEARLQRHLLRLTFLLLCIWLVHAGAWMCVIIPSSKLTRNRPPTLSLPASTLSSGQFGPLVVPVSSSRSMEA